ncbi:MAG: hypothetical protein OXH51_17515 [Gemmatimonadetes bacterium]|nr:hypothetical protein [Gemmatimonadota bacterium]
MAIHDAYARLTPYEVLLPDAEFPERHFPGIADEADQRGVDPANPAAFVMLGQVQAALAELRAEDAAPESANDHGSVLFFVYHLWRTEGTVVLTQQKTMRALLSGGTELPKDGRKSLWSKELGGRAGYVQLPQHLVWLEEARNDPQEGHGASQPARDVSQETRNVSPAGCDVSQETHGNPPESVDGFLWFGDSHGALHLTLVAGMRGDRPGFSVVPVPPLPLDAMSDWATGPAREGGGDFATSLPGAELDGLLGIRTPAEVFKLAALILARLARERPQASPPPVADRPPGTREDSPAAAGPTPSALPYATL